jgi:hypothetical protein
MDRVRNDVLPGQRWFYWYVVPGMSWRIPMLDVLYVGLTIVVFAVLFLIVKGVEHFER